MVRRKTDGKSRRALGGTFKAERNMSYTWWCAQSREKYDIHMVVRSKPREVCRTHGGALKAWKALLSEAVVTEGEALGKYRLISCLEGSTLHRV